MLDKTKSILGVSKKLFSVSITTIMLDQYLARMPFNLLVVGPSNTGIH